MEQCEHRPMPHRIVVTRTCAAGNDFNVDQCYFEQLCLEPILHRVIATRANTMSTIVTRTNAR